MAKLAGKPLKFTDYVKPVCLPTFVPPVGDKLMITGWGSTQDVGPAKEKLKEIPLPLTSQKICAEQWGSKYPNLFRTDSYFFVLGQNVTLIQNISTMVGCALILVIWKTLAKEILEDQQFIMIPSGQNSTKTHRLLQY